MGQGDEEKEATKRDSSGDLQKAFCICLAE